MNYYYSDMFFIQLYWAKSDAGVIIFQISGGKFLNFYEKVGNYENLRVCIYRVQVDLYNCR